MNIVLAILLVLLGIIALLLVMAVFMRNKHYINRQVTVNAPLPKVFDFLRLLKNQDKFNKYAKADPSRKEEFKGTDGTVGFIYSWSGNKNVGEGAKEIISITEGKRIETEIRFIKPMKVSASIIFETEALSENQTRVSFINTGILKYPFNVMIPVFEKNFAKDMDESLATLKNILEK